MATVALAVARGGGSGDFIVGLLVGLGVGFLLGPTVRSWLVWREWGEASRQTRLADEVLARMEEDLEVHGEPGPSRSSGRPSNDHARPGSLRPRGEPTLRDDG